MLEVSYDTAKTWSVETFYNLESDSRWEDQSADPGDWAFESFSIGGQGTGLVFLRFRLIAERYRRW